MSGGRSFASVAEPISTVAGVGRLPRAQAAAASVVGFALFSLPWRLGVASAAWLLLAVVSFLAGRAYIDARAVKDPRELVSDELLAAGLVAIAFTGDWLGGIAALVLFRVIDVAKPWPLGPIHELRTWMAVFLDDLLAAGLAIVLVKTARTLL